MYSARGDGPDAHRVSPFGDPRIKACSRLPGAYRSKPRPSSPAGAKASIVCPYTLDRIRDLGPGRRCNFYPELCYCQRTSRGRTRGSGPRRLRGGKPVSAARGEPVVGVPGIEPGTSSLSGTRSNQLSYTPGATRPPPETRIPDFRFLDCHIRSNHKSKITSLKSGLVEATGIEPVTSCLQSTCSTN